MFEGAFKRRIGDRVRVGYGRILVLVPDEERVRLAGFGLFGFRAFGMVAQQLAGRCVHQEREGRVLTDERLVVELFVQNDGVHGQKQRSVRARLDGNPLVGFASGGGEMRVDCDHLCARFFRLEEQAGVRQA